MTKREIFQRLQNIRDFANLENTFDEDAVRQNATLRDGMKYIADYIGDLLLDIAAPEEEPKPETPEAESVGVLRDDCDDSLGVLPKKPCDPVIWIEYATPVGMCKCGSWRYKVRNENSAFCVGCRKKTPLEPKRGEGEK